MNTELTVVILSWKRPENIPLICNALRTQTIVVRIVIWNNEGHYGDWDCDEQYASLSNQLCWPRWFVAARAKTEYVACMDDDLKPNSRSAFETLLDCSKRYSQDERCIVGIEGVRLSKGAGYFPRYPRPWMRNVDDPTVAGSSVHLGYVKADTPVDIVKGRFMLLRSRSLNDVPFSPPHSDFCDDIAISAIVGRGRPRPHVLCAVARGDFCDLPGNDGQFAMCNRAYMPAAREAGTQHYFGHSLSGDASRAGC